MHRMCRESCGRLDVDNNFQRSAMGHTNTEETRQRGYDLVDHHATPSTRSPVQRPKSDTIRARKDLCEAAGRREADAWLGGWVGAWVATPGSLCQAMQRATLALPHEAPTQGALTGGDLFAAVAEHAERLAACTGNEARCRCSGRRHKWGGGERGVNEELHSCFLLDRSCARPAGLDSVGARATVGSGSHWLWSARLAGAQERRARTHRSLRQLALVPDGVSQRVLAHGQRRVALKVGARMQGNTFDMQGVLGAAATPQCGRNKRSWQSQVMRADTGRGGERARWFFRLSGQVDMLIDRHQLSQRKIGDHDRMRKVRRQNDDPGQKQSSCGPWVWDGRGSWSGGSCSSGQWPWRREAGRRGNEGDYALARQPIPGPQAVAHCVHQRRGKANATFGRECGAIPAGGAGTGEVQWSSIAVQYAMGPGPSSAQADAICFRSSGPDRPPMQPMRWVKVARAGKGRGSDSTWGARDGKTDAGTGIRTLSQTRRSHISRGRRGVYVKRVGRNKPDTARLGSCCSGDASMDAGTAPRRSHASSSVGGGELAPRGGTREVASQALAAGGDAVRCCSSALGLAQRHHARRGSISFMRRAPEKAEIVCVSWHVWRVGGSELRVTEGTDAARLVGQAVAADRWRRSVRQRAVLQRSFRRRVRAMQGGA